MVEIVLGFTFIVGTIYLVWRDCKLHGGFNWALIIWLYVSLLGYFYIFGRGFESLIKFGTVQQFVFWVVCMPCFIYFLKNFFDAKNAVISWFGDFWRSILNLPTFPALHEYLDGLIIGALSFINIIGMVWSTVNLLGPHLHV